MISSSQIYIFLSSFWRFGRRGQWASLRKIGGYPFLSWQEIGSNPIICSFFILYYIYLFTGYVRTDYRNHNSSPTYVCTRGGFQVQVNSDTQKKRKRSEEADFHFDCLRRSYLINPLTPGDGGLVYRMTRERETRSFHLRWDEIKWSRVWWPKRWRTNYIFVFSGVEEGRESDGWMIFSQI